MIRGRILLALSVSFILCASSVRGADKASTVLSALPADTIFVVQIPSVAELRKKIEQSPFYKIKDLPDVAPVIDNLKSTLDAVRAEAKAEAGFDPWDFITSIDGEVVMSYGSLQPLEKALTEQVSGVQPQVTSENLAFLLIVDAGAEKEKFKETLAKVLDLGRKDGVKIESTAFHGGQLTTIAPPEGSSDEELKAIYVSENGSRFLLGLNKTLVEQVTVNIAEGKSSGLAEDQGFQSTFSVTGKSSDFFCFVNIKSITSSLGNALNATFFGFFWQQFQNLVMGQSLNNVGIGVGISPKEVRQTVFVNNGGAKDGVLGWLGAPPITPSPAAYTPDDAKAVSSLSIDMGKIFGFLRDIAQTALSVQGGGDFDMFFEQRLGMKFNDLQRAFGNRVDLFSVKPGDMENPFGDGTVIVSLNNAEPLKELMTRVDQMAPGTFETADYQGHKVRAIAGGGVVSPAVSITDNSLIFSFDAENVRKVIRRLKNESSELGNSAAFKAAAAGSPGKVNFFQYQSADSYKQAEAMYSMAVEQFVSGLESSSGADVPPGLDKALVAAIKACVAAFGDTFAWGAWQGPGFYVEGVTPFVK